jgi:hypothetical protein
MKQIQILPRKLSIDFELYTEGDLQLKKELVTMMIQNVRELDHALEYAVLRPEQLKKTIHKIVPTISIINDYEFAEVLQIPKRLNDDPLTFAAELNRFRIQCKEVVTCLEHELEWKSVLNKAV